MTELFTENLIPERTLGNYFQENESALGLASSANPVITTGGTISGAAYKSNDSGARIEIRPEWDPTIGLVTYNASNTQTFKIEIDGTNTGDITIGNYAGAQGVLWDQSAGTFNIKGTFTATAGTIGGWTINSTSIYTGTEDHSGYTANAGDITIYSDGSDASIHGKNFYIDASGNLFCTSATVTGVITTSAGSSIGTGYLTGTIAQANLNVADRGWSQTCAFSITDADTVAWGAGTFTSADGTAYSIDAGNTGDMAAKTYIYLDIATSETVYQTTTTSTTAVGVGKVLIAIAQNATGEATYKVMQGQGGENIDAASIVAGSITANEIAATTITAAKMNVTSLSSIVADMGSITAGNITLSTAGYIKGGQTAYNTGTGFFLGYDTSAYKFSIGVSTGDRMLWDGSGLTIVGKVSITGMSGTAGEALSAGEAVYLKGADSELYLTDAATNTETIHNYKGVVIADAVEDATANLYTSGVIGGFTFDFTDTIAETIDWNQYTQARDDYCTIDCSGDYFVWTTGNYVGNLTTAIAKLEHIFSGEVAEQRVINSCTMTIYDIAASGVKGSSLGSKLNACVTSCTGEAGQNPIVEWTFVFDPVIVLQPRTRYAVAVTYSAGSGGTIKWQGCGSGETCSHGTTSYIYDGNIKISSDEVLPMFKTYYTAANYCSLGDSVYLTDTPGAMDYIPGTYQKAIGTILSTTEILSPYEPEKLITKTGIGWASGTTTGVPVPRNARKAIIQFSIGSSDPWAGEMTLINPIKMSGVVSGDINDTNASFSATWSGNFITFSATSETPSGTAYITFLT